VFESVLESSSILLGVLFSSRTSMVMRWTILGSVLVERLLHGVFSWQRCLPMWGVRWTGWPTPCTGLWSIAAS
jgi:hypothetical protein